ncbi:MAG TPA: serine hydrolase domain-containing protein [Herpetosiphonaceae bacterium]|nr:serine hydrolase domain-containing protein [Herpetosiphonaceae bacterium]
MRPIVEETMASFTVRGVVVAVQWEGRQPERLIVGTDGAGNPLAEDALFPVASLTKLATALAVLRLADRGALALDDELARHLPDAAAARPGVTIRRLLTHTAGLPESYPEEPDIYKIGLTWPAIAGACLRSPLAESPGARVLYSGVGYSLLAVVVERLADQPFPRALADLVLTPLNVEAYLGVEPPRAPAQIDVDNILFAGTELEFYNSPFFRGLGEPASGLLTTTDGVLALIGANGNPTYLSDDTRREATRNHVGSLGGGVPGWFELPVCPWALGPALQGTFPWAPANASAASYGHTGASGCIVWHDPAARISWAILGTQVAETGWCDESFPRIGAAILASIP